MTKPALAFTPAVEKETAHIRKKMPPTISEAQWQREAPYIPEIERLKKERNAFILAHNYQSPLIYHSVADVVGDSLKLAQEAVKVDADVIVQAGVYFMAETSKLLNPNKKVLIPDVKAGCSLAESITPVDIEQIRLDYPGAPVMTYVNTTADVKAASDICCTSGNALLMVQKLQAMGHDTIIFLPDAYLARNIAKQTDVRIVTWEKGKCEVHERFTPQYIRELRAEYGDVDIIAHPECHPDVIAESDFAGSTAQMQNYIEKNDARRVVLITECSMSENLYADNPHIEFVKPCQLCPHMQRISLSKILNSLQTLTFEVEVDPKTAAKARQAIDRMLELSI